MAHFIYPPERRLFRAGIGESATGPLCVNLFIGSDVVASLTII